MNFAPVSVVVPCYRCAATIERAVASIAAQTLLPAEVLLVDDASGDETLAVLNILQARHGEWLRVLAFESNRGAASARNAGWDAAHHPFIAFLDADDAWHRRKIEIQYSYMHAHPEVALSGHLCRQVPPGADDTPQWNLGPTLSEQLSWRRLLVRHSFVTPSVMLKREIDLRFAEGMRYMEDHRLWLEIVSASLVTVKLNMELVAVYKPVYGASGLSADMWSMEKAELSNYRYFCKQGKISLWLLSLLQCYSLAKYARRLFIVHFLHRS